MESIRQRGAPIEGIIKLSSTSFFVLSIICFMVFTTQNYTHAEDEDLGYDIKSANASVTVGTACTFTATVDSAHSANISNGIYGTDIGKTTLNTVCNDSGGYAIYAIGFSNDKYGATDLSSDISSTYNISTGTNTSGDSSSWAMKLASEPGTTAATIENGYDNYNIVPDDYTKVATLNTVTDPGSTTSATGSSISTTYQTYISPTQPAGIYTGKVKYTLVHPSTSPKPEKPVFMQDIAAIKAKLINEGDTMQAIDSRDGKKYWITKLADGNIWMTQNLDLDIEAGRTYTSADTDLAYSSVGTTWIPSVSTSTTSSWTSSATTPSSYDPGDLYWDGIITTSEGTLDDNTTTTGNIHYHIGNYYNWTAAIAMNRSGSYTNWSQDPNQSICPSGWRLPTYHAYDRYYDKSYRNLVDKQGLTAGINGNIQNSPTYFIYGGNWTGRSGFVGSDGHFWTNIAEDSYWAYQLLFFAIGQDIYTTQSAARELGYPIRCVAR